MADKDISFGQKDSFVSRQESSYGWSSDGDGDDTPEGSQTRMTGAEHGPNESGNPIAFGRS